jgi:hypothetical protein
MGGKVRSAQQLSKCDRIIFNAVSSVLLLYSRGCLTDSKVEAFRHSRQLMLTPYTPDTVNNTSTLSCATSWDAKVSNAVTKSNPTLSRLLCCVAYFSSLGETLHYVSIVSFQRIRGCNQEHLSGLSTPLLQAVFIVIVNRFERSALTQLCRHKMPYLTHSGTTQPFRL